MRLYNRMLKVITDHRTWITRRMIAVALSGGKHIAINPHHIIILSHMERDGVIEVRKVGVVYEYRRKA